MPVTPLTAEQVADLDKSLPMLDPIPAALNAGAAGDCYDQALRRAQHALDDTRKGDKVLLLVDADGRRLCYTALGQPDKARGTATITGDLPAGEARELLQELGKRLNVNLNPFAELDKPMPAIVLRPEHDPVDHPRHYTSLPACCSACGAPIECIDVTRHCSFNLGNAMKYLWREGLKAGVEDLRKAVWYVQDEIRQREKGGA